jgi:hypothetical protein
MKVGTLVKHVKSNRDRKLGIVVGVDKVGDMIVVEVNWGSYGQFWERSDHLVELA